ncbi:MAG: phosphoglycerate kinase [Gammaproteobacteria bacterium]|nr:phosphoglycerate kinase [Gammaproteobacteria bacterium]
MAPSQLSDHALPGKRVLVREDFNVPLSDGAVASDARIEAALPTIRTCIEGGAAVILVSHLGRPTEGDFDPEQSLAPVADHLSRALDIPVPLVRDWRGGVDVAPGGVVLLENVRFEPGEAANDDGLARALASLCDLFVMDAFATAHRAHASTHGVAKFAPAVCAGPLMAAELDALGRALEAPQRPLVAIVGGAKVSTKLELLESLAGIADRIIVGGGIANTFVLAAGNPVGASLVEPSLAETAMRIAKRVDVPLPVDVMTAPAIDANVPAVLRRPGEVGERDMILDIGPGTARAWRDGLAEAGTIIWNGPLGVFEFDQFGEGTRLIAEGVAEAEAFSIAGGGDTIAAIDKYGVREGISYISTGGGAFLEFVERGTLPAVEILKTRAR